MRWSCVYRRKRQKVDTEMNFQEEIPCKTWTAPKPLWVKCNNGNTPNEEKEVLRF